MKRFLFLVGLLALWASPSIGQGTPYSNVVLQSGGFPNATIRVCKEPATGTPCSPLANIYSDPALTQVLSNPFPSDSNGNFIFYALPTQTCLAPTLSSLCYHVQISGNGFTTPQDIPYITLPGSGGSSGGSNISINGTLFPTVDLNSTFPAVDAGFTAATLKASGTSVITEFPTLPPPLCQTGSGIGSTLFIGFQGTINPCLNPAIEILQQPNGGMELFGPVSLSSSLFANSIFLAGNGVINNQAVNCSSNATVLGKLAKFNGGCLVITTTGDTANILGVVTGSGGPGIGATIAIAGLPQCIFDGSTTAGDWFVNSPTIAGDCHDTGSIIAPTTSQGLGYVTTTNVGLGTYQVYVASAGGSGGGGGSGTVSPGAQYQMPVYLAAGSTVGPSAFLTDNQATGQLSYSGALGLNLTAIGTPVWTGAYASCPAVPAGTQSAICFGTSGIIQGSQAGGSYAPFVFQNAISGSWINSGVVDISFLNTSQLNAAYFQTTNGTGSTIAAVTAASDVISAATGSGICTDVNHNATTIGCPAGSGAANTALSNVASVTAFGSNLQFAAGFGTLTTTSNGNLSLLPNGTGAVVIPAGTNTAPGLLFQGDNAGNGIFQPNAGSIAYVVSNIQQWQITIANGFRTKASLCYEWSPSTNASLATDTALGRASAGVFEIGATCGTSAGGLNLGTLTLEGSSSGSAPITASATGGSLNLGSTNAVITSAGAATFANLSTVGSVRGGVNLISFSTTPVLNMALGNIQQFSCTTPSSAISPTTSGLLPGQVMTLIFVQNSGTACTLSYPSTMHGGTSVGSSLGLTNVQSFVVSNNGTDMYAVAAMATNMTGGTP